MIQNPAPGIDNLVPELRAVLLREGIDPTRLTMAFPVVQGSQSLLPVDRHRIVVSDGQRTAPWEVRSLRALFRGATLPPDLARYPKEYVPHFHDIESQVVSIFDLSSRRSDQEMEEIYGTMRRRPDGRSLGPMHDYVWSITAFFLGRFVVSQAEFEAIFQRLSASARHFSMQPQSYNYAEHIGSMLG